MKDVLLNTETSDLEIKDGDLFVSTSDRQHQHLLMICEKGSYKQFPLTGVGAASYLENEDKAAFLREVRTQFTADGMTVSKIAIEEGKLKINASY